MVSTLEMTSNRIALASFKSHVRNMALGMGIPSSNLTRSSSRFDRLGAKSSKPRAAPWY